MDKTATDQHAQITPYIPFPTTGSYPVRYGNIVRPLIDGEPAFRRICEAVEAAQKSVWVTVVFMHPDFEMPDGRGSLFDVLDAAVARGVDVRAIFWRMNEDVNFPRTSVFSGEPHHLDHLGKRGSQFLARWDRAHGAYCQHQKSWLIDAGLPEEIAFVGGINLDPESVVTPGHGGHAGESTHDVYAEIRGPAATDVHHNFVQRWNEASDRAERDGVWPSHELQGDLPFPGATSPAAGDAIVHIQRTVRAGRYTDPTPPPGGEPFAIHEGESSIHAQYLAAIDAARRTIYLEDQSIASQDIVDRLDSALTRGVDVVYLVPADANGFTREARANPRSRPFFEKLASLSRHPHFSLVGIAAKGSDGISRNIYVHAKICLIDDCWATIGSCNVANRSFFGDTELNASFWAPDVVKSLRRDLLEEHLGIDTSALDDRTALELYREIARANAERRAKGEEMAGLAFEIDPATYGA